MGAIFASRNEKLRNILISPINLLRNAFASDPITPERPNLQESLAQQGAPEWRVYGERVRVPGVLTWASRVREEKDDSLGGSKGGSGGEFIQYKYYADAQYSFARTNRPISRFLRVFANGTLFYNVIRDLSITSNELVATTFDAGGFNRLRIRTSNPTVDLTQIRSGKDVTISGWANSENNGTFRCRTSKSLRLLGNTEFRIFIPTNALYVFRDEGAGASVTVTQTSPLFRESQVADLRFYHGSPDEQPDERIVEIEEGTGGNLPAGATPAWRKRVRMVCEDLLLTDFGNGLPTMEALLEVEAGQTDLRTNLDLILSDWRLTEDEYDTSLVSGTLLGYAVPGFQSLSDVLAPLILAKDLVVFETTEGKIVFKSRTAVDTITIRPEDLAAEEVGVIADRPFSIADKSEDEFPQDFLVRYLDPDVEYQRAIRHSPGFSEFAQDPEEVTLDVVLDKDEAQQIANRLYATAQANRQTYRLTLPPSYLSLTPGIRATASNVDGEDWTFLLTKVEQGANWLHVAEAMREDPDALVQTATSEARQNSQQAASFVGDGPNQKISPLEWGLIDTSPVADRYATQPGFIAFAANADQDANWRGAVLWNSLDGGLTRARIAELPAATTCGWVDTRAQPMSGWDHDTVVTVEQIYGTHSSVSLAQCELGANRYAWGSELVGIATWEYMGDGIWQGRNILRGIADTGEDGGLHDGSIEVLVSLTKPGPIFVPYNQVHIDQIRHYSIQAAGSPLDDAETLAFCPKGENVRPPRARKLRARKNRSGEIFLAWRRGTRAMTRPGLPDPLMEEVEAYEIEIIDDGRVVATERTSKPSYVWTPKLASQLKGRALTFRVYQISNLVGRGRPREVTL